MSQFEIQQQQVVAACRVLVGKGYLTATGGNISLLVRGHRAFAITPSNYDYSSMTPDDVCVLDFDLKLLAGEKPSIESSMHAAVYQTRPDVQAVIHTHQVYASALALINAPIPTLFDEQARFLGRSVEIIPYAPSGTGLLKKKIVKHLRNHHNAYIIQNHGVLCLGQDMQRALHNVEILEKCSLAYLLALCTEQEVSRIPLVVREIAFAKLRQDQKRRAPPET